MPHDFTPAQRVRTQLYTRAFSYSPTRKKNNLVPLPPQHIIHNKSLHARTHAQLARRDALKTCFVCAAAIDLSYTSIVCRADALRGWRYDDGGWVCETVGHIYRHMVRQTREAAFGTGGECDHSKCFSFERVTHTPTIMPDEVHAHKSSPRARRAPADRNPLSHIHPSSLAHVRAGACPDYGVWMCSRERERE